MVDYKTARAGHVFSPNSIAASHHPLHFRQPQQHSYATRASSNVYACTEQAEGPIIGTTTLDDLTRLLIEAHAVRCQTAEQTTEETIDETTE